MEIPATFELSDIPLAVEAQIKCFRLSLQELLEMRPGSIIKSRRAAGDSVDIKVGGQMICQGEIIVIDNQLAVRLSDFEERS